MGRKEKRELEQQSQKQQKRRQDAAPSAAFAPAPAPAPTVNSRKRERTASPPPAPASAVQQQQRDDADAGSDLKRFLRAWQWKREHLPDRLRFAKPYVHTLSVDGGAGAGAGAGGAAGAAAAAATPVAAAETTAPVTLTIRQGRFNEEGFASTVWDSAIVVAKWAERWQERLRGRRCLDLSAGCGLVGVALARLGARGVVATDLEANLPLLRANCEANGASGWRGHLALSGSRRSWCRPLSTPRVATAAPAARSKKSHP